ncbi:MAG TPA: hypothetical protein VIQ30_24285 [Pseudonocardia sp.]
MPEPFMVEKIRSGETEPYAVHAMQADGSLVVTNFDEGTVAVTTIDGETTVGPLDASD